MGFGCLVICKDGLTRELSPCYRLVLPLHVIAYGTVNGQPQETLPRDLKVLPTYLLDLAVAMLRISRAWNLFVICADEQSETTHIKSSITLAST